MSHSLRMLALLTLATAVLPLAMPAQLTTGEQFIVQAPWLVSHLKDANLVILHVGPKEDYDKEHIPGARFVQHEAFMAPGPPSTEMLPEPTMRSNLEKLGISDRTTIVVTFSSEWMTPATRILTTLAHFGFGDHALFLDGGMGAWQKVNGPLTAALPNITPGKLSPRTLSPLIVDNSYVATLGAHPRVKLIDARAPVFYSGPGSSGTPGGHIPGARNIPFNSLSDGTATLLPRTKLQEIFRAAGVMPGDTVVAYCHVGQQATFVLTAARILGHTVRLYDGSMDDWSTRKLPLDTTANRPK